jgi:hypothetical protein
MLFLFSFNSISAENQLQSSHTQDSISKALSEWENVKANIENGDSMLIYNKEYKYPREADWIMQFKYALSDLGYRSDYLVWLKQFFGNGFPIGTATAEVISTMTLNDISYWITYLNRFDYWNDGEGHYTVIIDEIENGRMEALMENLMEKAMITKSYSSVEPA